MSCNIESNLTSFELELKNPGLLLANSCPLESGKYLKRGYSEVHDIFFIRGKIKVGHGLIMTASSPS